MFKQVAQVLLSLSFLIGISSAQTLLDPSQILPSSNSGYVLTTVDGVTAWHPNGSNPIVATPQFQLLIQPNAGTQQVGGGASPTQNAVTGLLQGIINTDFQATGGGNTNGIANSLTSVLCSNIPCTAITPANSNSTEILSQYGASNNSLDAITGTVVGTDQGGQQTRVYQDPISPGNTSSNAFNYNLYITQSLPSGVNFPNYGKESTFASFLAGGYDEWENTPIGPNFKSNYYYDGIEGYKTTSGQFTARGITITCPGSGDCIAEGDTVQAGGGTSEDLTDEGPAALRPQIFEQPVLIFATATSIDANIITVGGGNYTSHPFVGDEGHIEDWNHSRPSTTDGCIITGNVEQASPTPYIILGNAPGSTCTFGSNWIALATTPFDDPSSYPRGASGTVTVTISTSGIPSGWATSTSGLPSTGVACVSDSAISQVSPDYFEMSPYTVISGTTLSITFQRPHPRAPVISIGAPCGSLFIPNAHVYGTVASIPISGTNHQSLMIVGSVDNKVYIGDSARTASSWRGTSDITEGEVNFETASITSLTRDGAGTVTAVVSGFVPASAPNAILSFSGAIDNSFNTTCPLITIINGQTFTCSMSGSAATTTGGTATFNNAQYTVVQGAKILHAANPATKSIDGVITIYPSNWSIANGDSLVFPHGSFLNINLIPNAISSQTTPRPDYGDTTYGGQGGARITLGGRAGPLTSGLTIVNATPITTYYGHNGTKNIPAAAFSSTGIFKWIGQFEMGDYGGFAFHPGTYGPTATQLPFIFDLTVSGGTAHWQFNPNTGQMRWACTESPLSGDCPLSVNGADLFYSPITQVLQVNIENGGPYAGLWTRWNGVTGAATGVGEAGVNFAPGADPSVLGASLCSMSSNILSVGINGLCGNTGEIDSGTVKIGTSLYLLGVTGSTQCLQAASSGLVSGTGSSCGSGGGSSTTVASAEIVSFSATPTFSVTYNVSRIVLTGNITSFTLGTASDGQDKTLCFKQGSGAYSVTPPANVHGFFILGTTNAGWNCQTFSYDNGDSIWLATGAGVINQ
jgi:hypothetical protein